MYQLFRRMARVAVLGALLAAAGAAGVCAQPADVPVEVEAMADAFGEGDVRALLTRTSERLEIAVFGASRLYSRSQARYVLEAFFRDYAPDRFDLRDVARAGGGAFAEGDYWYARGASPLRVYLRLRREGGSWELREILIEQRQP